MASLSNTKIKDTYQSLVKFSDNGNITIGAKRLTDGFGNNSPLYVSTTQIGIGITPQSGYGLHVSSNVKIGSNLEVSGNLTVNGTLTYLNVVDLEVDDPLIQLAVNNAANILDIGLFGKYVSSGTKYKGLFNDASDDKFKLFTGLTTKPLTTVDTSATGYTVATLVANLEGNVTGNLTGNADTSTKIASITNSNIVQLTTTQTLTNKTLTSPTITGTGAIAGAFTGDLTGDVTGGLTGNVIGNLTGDVTGDVTGGLTGNVIGNVTGNLTGNVTGNVTGNAYLNTIAYQGGEGTELNNSAFNVDGIGTTFRWIESNSGATGTTWKKVADIVITNTITPNGVQMEAKVYQPNTNSGVTAGLNTVYYSIAFRGRIDDSSTHNDAIVYGQDANLLRVYKTADYTFELQARSNDDNRDLVVECNITSKKGGKVTPTTTYTDGTATGGTAYTASGNALNKTKFAGNVEFEGAIFDSAEVEDLRVNELLYFGSGATSGYGPHIKHSDSGGTGKGMRITVDSDLQVWGVTGNAGEQHQGLEVAGGVAKLYDMNGVVLETVLGGVDITGTLDVSGTITGDVTGDLTGNVTGNLTGNVTGNLTGNVAGGTISGTTGTFTGDVFIGATGTTPKVDMMYLDSASGLGWDTRIFIGKSDDLPNGSSFPTHQPAGGYGIQFQANSDGAFFGIEEYTTGNYTPVINWGDDVGDTPMTFRFNGTSIFTIDYLGNIAGTGATFAGNILTTGYLYWDANNSVGLSYVKSGGNLNLIIDSNNNQTTAAFIIEKDTQTAGSGTEIFRVQENGNVGIGTDTPTSILELKEASIVPRITLLKTGIVTWYIGNPTQGTSNNFTIGTDSGGNTEILTLSNTGNVGIGTASPQSTLHVDGDIRRELDGTSTIGFGSGSTSAWYSGIKTVDFGAQNIGLTLFTTTNAGTTNVDALTIDEDGNVGIGRTSIAQPSSGATTLAIQGTSTTKAGAIRLYSSDDSVAAYIWADNTSGLSINTSTSHPMVFRTVAAERMRLDTSGNLILNQATSRLKGGGTTTGKLELLNSDSTSYIIINGSANAAAHEIGFVTNESLAMKITSSGNVDVNGIIYTGDSLRFNGTGLNATDKKLYSPYDGVLEWMTHTAAGQKGFAVSHQGTKIVYFNASGDSYINGGNVGIGTTTLNTISGTNPTLTLGGTGISGGLILQRAGTDTARLYENAGNMVHQGMTGVGHHFYVNAATQAMVIDSSGNVGINDTNPNTANLSIKGQSSGVSANFPMLKLLGQNTSSDGLHITTTGSGNDYYAIKVATGGNSSSFNVTNAGNVGIGTTTPQAALTVAHDLSSSGDATGFRLNAAVGATSNTLFGGPVSSGDYAFFQSYKEGTSAGVRYLSLNPIGGNVGIGTTLPGRLLELSQSASGAQGATLRLTNSVGGAGAGVAVEFNGPGTQPIHAKIITVDAGAYDSDLIFQTKVSGTGGALTEKIKITVGGNISLNGGLLEFGNASSTPNIGYGMFHQSGVGLGINSSAGGAAQGIGFWLNNGSAYEAGRWLSNGNFGIGRTSPTFKLDVGVTTSAQGIRVIAGNAYANLDIESSRTSGNIGGIRFVTTGDANKTAEINGIVNDGLRFVTGTGGSDVLETAMSITGTHKVGIGTITPRSNLHVAKAGNVNGGTILIGKNESGTGKWSFLASAHYNQATGSGNGSGAAGVALIGSLTTSSVNTIYIGGGPYEINAATDIRFYTHNSIYSTAGGSLRMYINNAGNVGIGNTNNSYKLDVTGTIRATSDVIAYSDRRIKENIVTIDNALEKVTKLRGVTYTRKDIEDKSTKVGVIAQEVLEVLPEVVSKDNEGKYSVAYGNMAGVFIEAIKELENRIKELENKSCNCKSK